MRNTSLEEVTLIPPSFSASASTQIKSFIFTAKQLEELCSNEYFRYPTNSAVISHVIVAPDASAIQFKLPDRSALADPEVPFIGHLTQIEEFKLPNGNPALRGRTVGYTPMISNRSYTLQISEGDAEPCCYTYYPLSPTYSKPLHASSESIKRFNDDEATTTFLEKKSPAIKSSTALHVSKTDIEERAKIKYRNPDQNTVMGESAVVAFRTFLRTHKVYLTEPMQHILHDSAEADLHEKEACDRHRRTEWLHRLSYTLHPMAIDPQTKHNLGAARKCHNTAMMIYERTAKWFVTHTDAAVKLDCTFNMLLDSELVDQIDFNVTIRIGLFTIKLIQHIDAFEKNPALVKASDLATLIGILCMMIHHITPLSTQQITKPMSAIPTHAITDAGTDRATPFIPKPRATLFRPKRDRTPDNEAPDKPTMNSSVYP